MQSMPALDGREVQSLMSGGLSISRVVFAILARSPDDIECDDRVELLLMLFDERDICVQVDAVL